MRTKVDYSTIEIYWKEGKDVYKMFTKEREKYRYYHYNTTKNGMHHSLDGEHSIYTSSFGGTERYQAYHKDGILHNLDGLAEYTYQEDFGDDYRDINYYIEGQIIDDYNTYKQRVIEYKQNKKQEVKNALLVNTNICNDVCDIISEYVI
jgi:beta-galactosidase/beta-glucuronidase